MIWILASALTVGFVHSMAPGHWLPVVLMAKSRGWKPQTAAMASLVTAGGHIVLSVLIAGVAIGAGSTALETHEHQIEAYAGLGLALFGLCFAVYSYFKHAQCSGHTHHGPEPEAGRHSIRDALGFLFMVGFSPCIAVFPVFVASLPWGWSGWVLTSLAFSVGVMAALGGSVLMVSLGALKLDHPIFEHFGDVLTGGAMVLLGLGLFIFSHGGIG
jgi:nickel/cobalt exporter